VHKREISDEEMGANLGAQRLSKAKVSGYGVIDGVVAFVVLQVPDIYHIFSLSLFCSRIVVDCSYAEHLRSSGTGESAPKNVNIARRHHDNMYVPNLMVMIQLAFVCSCSLNWRTYRK
jgi:hypothetical protein